LSFAFINEEFDLEERFLEAKEHITQILMMFMWMSYNELGSSSSD
jgi:hypothetical protein